MLSPTQREAWHCFRPRPQVQSPKEAANWLLPAGLLLTPINPCRVDFRVFERAVGSPSEDEKQSHSAKRGKHYSIGTTAHKWRGTRKVWIPAKVIRCDDTNSIASPRTLRIEAAGHSTIAVMSTRLSSTKSYTCNSEAPRRSWPVLHATATVWTVSRNKGPTPWWVGHLVPCLFERLSYLVADPPAKT